MAGLSIPRHPVVAHFGLRRKARSQAPKQCGPSALGRIRALWGDCRRLAMVYRVAHSSSWGGLWGLHAKRRPLGPPSRLILPATWSDNPPIAASTGGGTTKHAVAFTVRFGLLKHRCGLPAKRHPISTAIDNCHGVPVVGIQSATLRTSHAEAGRKPGDSGNGLKCETTAHRSTSAKFPKHEPSVIRLCIQKISRTHFCMAP